jgi:hypothetical protein
MCRKIGYHQYCKMILASALSLDNAGHVAYFVAGALPSSGGALGRYMMMG